MIRIWIDEAVKIQFPVSYRVPMNFEPYQGDTSALSSLTTGEIVRMIVEDNVDVDAAFAEMRQEYLDLGGQGLINYITQNME